MRSGLLCLGGAVALLTGPSEGPREARSPAVHEAGAPAGHTAGAPAGHAGARGQPTCHACHNDLELNEAEGRLEVVGFPERYEAGRSYAVTLVLTSEGMERSGFQATVDAGDLLPLDVRTVTVLDSVGRPYIGHGKGGAMPDSPTRTAWSFEWVAPGPGRGGVILNAAANSANGDNSPMGDFIYTAVARSY